MSRGKLLSMLIIMFFLTPIIVFVSSGCSDEAPTISDQTYNLSSPVLEKVGFEGERIEYVPGEVIVKFKPGSFGINA